ncbi:alpha/beta hydrolase family protein [Mycobacterium sp. THU-M116]
MTSDTAPADPPHPGPDGPGALEGADVPAGAAVLPPLSALSPRERLVVKSSALGDLALRTWVASLLAATAGPVTVSAAVRRAESHDERANLSFYAALAAERDPAKSFPAPTGVPRVRSHPGHSVAERIAGGTVEDIAFPSSFTAINPSMRARWNTLHTNNIVRAQHWRHHDGPRPTLCVIHGFMGSSYLANGRFFSLPWYHRAGYDVLMYTLPFHGKRRGRFSPFSGFGYFSSGLGGFAEAMAQAVHDFRSILGYLRHTGVDRIALTGISLGGYTCALVASVDDRLEAVIPNCPVVTPATMFETWFPANKLVGLGLRLSGIGSDELAAGLAYHCPLNYRPLVPRDRRLLITGLGDRMAPPEQAVMLWEHWDRCALHWFPGSHILHVNQLDYLRRMTRFLRPVMF